MLLNQSSIICLENEMNLFKEKIDKEAKIINEEIERLDGIYNKIYKYLEILHIRIHYFSKSKLIGSKLLSINFS
jgi:hypothetical protein